MIDKSIFDRMDALVRKTGPEPEAVAAHFRIKPHPAYLGVNGMVVRVGKKYHIALNESQPSYQYIFAYWHELSHIIEEHLLLPGFLNGEGVHMDTDQFSSEYAKKMVVYTEKVSNLIAADRMLDGKEILTKTGYEAMESLRYLKRDLLALHNRLMFVMNSLKYNSSPKMKCLYAETRRELKATYEKFMDLESECSYSDFMTIGEIAAEYKVPEHYIEYALEAQRLRGADIDIRELKSFDKVFTKKREDNDW